MINNNFYSKCKNYNRTYNDNQPFPHLVFDDFLDQTLIEQAAIEAKKYTTNYLKLDSIGADEHADQQKKHLVDDILSLPPILQLICRYINGESFIRFLRGITNLDSIVGDSHLIGGGLHFTERGGHLGIHHDFNFMEGEEKAGVDIPLCYRKCNLILFLNDHWEDGWGGELELWNKSLTARTHSIMPKLNRAVLFNIENAPHGHPHPLNCPNYECRRTLAFYFYDQIPVNNKLYERAHWKYGQELL